MESVNFGLEEIKERKGRVIGVKEGSLGQSRGLMVENIWLVLLFFQSVKYHCVLVLESGFREISHDLFRSPGG